MSLLSLRQTTRRRIPTPTRIPLRLKGTGKSIDKRVKHPCAKPEVGLVAEETESLQRPRSKQVAQSRLPCDVQVVMPACQRAKSPADYSIGECDELKLKTVPFLGCVVECLLESPVVAVASGPANGVERPVDEAYNVGNVEPIPPKALGIVLKAKAGRTRGHCRSDSECHWQRC